MKIAETGFWQGNDTDKHHAFDTALANELSVLFKDKSVIDYGCGQGKYVELFNNKDIIAIGYDGNPDTENIKDCQRQDLTKNFYPSPLFDSVLSLEVGEHIPKELTAKYIVNLKRVKPELIVLSWAIPGQGGDGHVNELPNEEVIKMFSEYEYDAETSQHLRNAATLWWFKNTIMVFKSSRQAHNKG
jgi:hypothetical protein